MAEVWVMGAAADGVPALAATLRGAGHRVREIDVGGGVSPPDALVLAPTEDLAGGEATVREGALALLLARRPFSPAELLAAVERAQPVVDLGPPAPEQLLARLDSLLCDLRASVEQAADGEAVALEAALHQLHRANVTLLEALSGGFVQ